MTGRPPFVCETPTEALLAHRTHPPPPLATASPQVTPELHNAFTRMLAKDPAERPASMAEVVESLESCSASLPPSRLSAEITSTTAPGRSPRHVGSLLKGLAWVTALVLLAVVGWFAFQGVSSALAPHGTIVLDFGEDEPAGITVSVDDGAPATLDGTGPVRFVHVPVDEVDHELAILREGRRVFTTTVRFDVPGSRIVDVSRLPTVPAHNALRLEVGDYVRLTGLTLEEFDPLTIEMVVTPDDPLRGDDIQWILHAERLEDRMPRGLSVKLTKLGQPQFKLAADSPVESRRRGPWALTWKNEPLLSDEPVHVAVVIEDGVQSLFVDGWLIDRQYVGGVLGPSAELVIGGRSRPGDEPIGTYAGTIDEVRLSRVARYRNDFVPASRHEPDDETIALYHFDEDEGTIAVDASNGGHDGAIVGGSWVPGEDIAVLVQERRRSVVPVPEWASVHGHDHALGFAGKDEFLVVPDLLPGSLEPVTIEGWFNADGDGMPTDGVLFSTTCTVLVPPQGFHVRLESGHVVSRVHGVAADGSPFPSEIRSDEPLASQRDVHVAFSFDGQTQSLYVDGKRVDSRRVIGARPSISPLVVGADTNGDIDDPKYAAPFSGRADELRISRGTRYSGDFEPPRELESDESTLALYHCDEGLGELAHDASRHGRHAELINADWVRLAKGGAPLVGPPVARAPFTAEEAVVKGAWADFLDLPVEFENTAGMTFRLIPPGLFYAGSSDAERLEVVRASASLRRRVAMEAKYGLAYVANPFYLGVHEVTQSQYESIAGENPSAFSATGAEAKRMAAEDTARHPVEMVSWLDAVDFAKKLGERENPVETGSGEAPSSVGYRLPTELEWEHACRAGTTGPWFFDPEDADTYAWTMSNSASRTHAVGALPPNPFGLTGMLGNVREWVHDRSRPESKSNSVSGVRVEPRETTGVLRFIKGGTWNNDRILGRAGKRGRQPETKELQYIGFRLALPITAESAGRIRRIGALERAILAGRAGNLDLAETLALDRSFASPNRSQRETLARVLALAVATDWDPTSPAEGERDTARSRALDHLEWLVDHGWVTSEDVDHNDFRSLRRRARFGLLKTRLERWPQGRLSRWSGIAERHWGTLSEKLAANPHPLEFFRPHGFTDRTALELTNIRGAAALLVGDIDGFDAMCDQPGTLPDGGFHFAIIHAHPKFDHQRHIRLSESMIAKSSEPNHIAWKSVQQYRDGSYAEAIRTAEALSGRSGPWRLIADVSIAMSMAKSGGPDDAKKMLIEVLQREDNRSIKCWDDSDWGIVSAQCTLLRREAEELILGRSDSRELDDILILARRGDVDEALTRLAAFEERVPDPSPRFRYDLARAYTQCWHHLGGTGDPDRTNATADRAEALLTALHADGKLDPNSAHLAMDLRPLVTDARFLGLWTRLSPDVAATMEDEQLDRAFAAGDLKKAADIAESILTNRELTDVAEWLRLNGVLAKHAVDPSGGEAAAARSLAALQRTIDLGLLDHEPLDEFLAEFPALAERPEFAALDERIDANREKQTRLAEAFFALGGTVRFQSSNTTPGARQLRSPNDTSDDHIAHDTSELPSGNFAIWGLQAFSGKIDDEDLRELADEFSRSSSLIYISLWGKSVTGAGIVELDRLANSIAHLRLGLNTGIDDAALRELTRLENLSYVNLTGTAVSDSGLDHLKKITGLRRVVLEDTKVTSAGVAALRSALPQCEVRYMADPLDEALESGDLKTAADLAAQRLADDPLLNAAERLRLNRVLATHAAAPNGGEAAVIRSLAGLERLIDLGLLEHEPLETFLEGFPKLAARPEFAALDGRIDANREKQVRIAEAVFAKGGRVKFQTSTSLSGEAQRRTRSQDDDRQAGKTEELPEGNFGIWCIVIDRADAVDDDFLKSLVEKFAPIPPLLVVSLSNQPLSAAGIVALDRLTDSMTLILYKCISVDDAELRGLKEMRHVRGLNLGGTSVTDEGLSALHGMKALRWIGLGNTAVTPAGVAALQKALPNCDVYYPPPSDSTNSGK